jgi:hypothetical protein
MLHSLAWAPPRPGVSGLAGAIRGLVDYREAVSALLIMGWLAGGRRATLWDPGRPYPRGDARRFRDGVNYRLEEKVTHGLFCIESY